MSYNENYEGKSDRPAYKPRYRLAVGMMLLNSDNKVFIAKRINGNGDYWQMPQGGIDRNEFPLEAAMRELEEEIGTSNVKVLAESRDWYRYDLPAELQGVLWRGRFRGQKQRWYAMRYLGDDSEININTVKPEFCDWRWEDINLLPELIVPFKRKMYNRIVNEFRYLTFPGR